MNNEKDRNLTIIDKDGKEISYNILFTFNSEETNKDYIVFTDNKKDEDGNIMTYAASYIDLDDKMELHDIETEEEWSLIENLLSSIEDKVSE